MARASKKQRKVTPMVIAQPQQLALACGRGPGDDRLIAISQG